MKYILVIILWIMPAIAVATITGSEYEKKVYQIAYDVVFKLKDRYNTELQFDLPLHIKFLSESKISYTWCQAINHGNTKSKKFNKCINDDAVEAYYDINISTIFLRENLLFHKVYDVGSIVHEVVHYVQDMHGLTWRGKNSLCVPLIEYNAMDLETELLNELDIRIPDWYKNYISTWKKKFADRLTGKPNCSMDSLEAIYEISN